MGLAPAQWNAGLEREFVALVRAAALNPRFKAAGGKNLRSDGWTHLLGPMSKKEPSITTKEQLTSKWRRLKTEYADYNFLITRSGYGENLSDDQWATLDAGRNGIFTMKLSPYTLFKD